MLQGFMQRVRTPDKAPSWSATTALLLTLGFAVIWIAAQVIGVTLSGGDLTVPSVTGQVIGAAIASVVIALVVIQWVRRSAPDWRVALHLETSHTLPLFLCLLIGLGGAWAIDLFGVLTQLKGGQIVPPALSALVAPVNAAWILAAIVAIVLQPIGEELLLRGMLYPTLAGRLGNVRAILLTSAVSVGLAVILSGPYAWYAALQPLLMALVITTLRAHTRSTQMAIVARAMFGLFFVPSALITARF